MIDMINPIVPLSLRFLFIPFCCGFHIVFNRHEAREGAATRKGKIVTFDGRGVEEEKTTKKEGRVELPT